MMTDKEHAMEVQMIESSDEDEYDNVTDVIAPTSKPDSLQSPSPSKTASPIKGVTNTPTSKAGLISIKPPASTGQPNGVGIKTPVVSGTPYVSRYLKSPSNQQTVWTSAVKKPTGNVQRFISTTAGQQNQMITTPGSGSPAFSMVIGGANKPNYLVSPSGGTLGKPVNIVQYVSSDGQTKIVCQPGTNIVSQKDGRVISSSGFKQLGVLSQPGQKVLGPSSPGARCIPVQGSPRPAVIRGVRPVVISKTTGQTILTQATLPRTQTVKLVSPTVASSILTASTGANASLAPTSLQVTPTVAVPASPPESAGSVASVKVTPTASIGAAGTATSSVNVTAGVSGNIEQQPPASDNASSVVDSVGTKGDEAASSNDDKERNPSDTISLKEDPEESEPTEKKSAIRKATILSGAKPKLKTSLLAGAKSAEMTTFITNSPPSGAERIRKRKDNHKPMTDAEPPQKQLRTQQLEGSFLKALPGAEDLKASNIIKWDGMGLGMLPGSVVRFTKNAEGMLEIHQPLLNDKMEFCVENGEKRIRPRDPGEIYCCVFCSCYGLLSEFNTENFCSSSCLESFQSAVERISMKLVDEPLAPRALVEESRKAARRKIAEGDDKNGVPPAKQKKNDDSTSIVNDESNQDSSKRVRSKLPSSQADEKKQSDDKRPVIKLKSMEFLNASQNASGRQLRARESLVKKPMSKFVTGHDLEGEVSDDDEKIQNENTDPFPWPEYLVKTDSKPAWVKLFQNPNPVGPNPFKIGFKLEAVDPERQGLFCAATIADVQGHRVKIHFDGYSNKYDFWTNIDSPYIFECGFCERHNISLQPPCGMKKNTFNWSTYQAARKVRPCHLSWFRRYASTATNMFRPGMKLEAVDKKNTQLTCVATCTGVLDNRILVHFDSWSDVYDYWVDTSSPYIHPVGWCKSRNRELTPPNYYNPATFSWEAYLKETKSEAAPLAAFTLRPPIEWKKNTKLEAIDKRAPHLLRVATIREVLPYQIKIVFDGFPAHFGYWVDDDCPDIHPTNWGLKTGHQVSAPPEPYQIQNSKCPTPGCIGDGNWKGLHTDKHSSADECPYSNEHLNAESPLQDRISDKKFAPKKKPPVLGHEESDSESDEDPEANWKFLDAAVERTSPKTRLGADGSSVLTPGKRSLPYVLPSVQGFKGPTAVLKSVTGEDIPVKTDEGIAEKKRKLERKGSDGSLEEVSSQEAKPGGRGVDKNAKPVSRRSQPVKATATQAESPGRGRALAKADSSNDFFNRIRTKVTTDLYSTADILTWNYDQCVHKIKNLPPKCQASLKKLKLNGERFLLLTNLLQNQLFEDLTAAESKSLHNAVTLLHTEAVTGLDKWKPIRSNSKFGNPPKA